MAKSPKKPPGKIDRGVVVSGYTPIPWMATPGMYIAGRAALDEADALEVELELKWGRDRLRLLVDTALREKFDRQRYLTSQARWQGNLEEVKREAARMANAWKALDRAATQSGAKILDPSIWEVCLEDGTVATIAITAYPRLDQNDKFNGKVLIAENVTGRLNWQRKVVLGEAAQRWLHRLKGNLATARIYLENLQEDRRLDVQTRDRVLPDYIPAVNDQIRQTAETANKILHFASISKPEPVRCEINALIDRAAEPYLANPRSGLTVAKEQQADLPEISVDPNQIKEVLDNLLSNAIFSMKQGGKLGISSHLAEDLPSKSSLRMVEIVVEDTGVGIDVVDLERIFQPGFSRSGSTGVGLALVKEIVENHGGQIKVESQPGKGSRFIVRLPSQEIEQ